METAPALDPLLDELRLMISKGDETEKVLNFLLNSGIDSHTASEMIIRERSSYLKKRRHRGFILGAIGSALLLIGFLLTVIFFHSGVNFHFVMYGLTSIGAILLMAGLVEVIGW